MSEENRALPSSVPSTGAGEDNPAPEPALKPADPWPDASAPPSWGQVIGTTARLWLERHMPGWLSRRNGSVTMRRRLTSVIILVIVVFAAGVLAVAVANGVGTSSAAGRGQPGNGRVAAASAARSHAANWITQQVSRGATVACDPVMCSVLQARHFPSGNLIALGPSAADPLGSAIVVSTQAIRSQFRQHLVSVYAPVIIASFGSGTARVDVRVTAADGSAAYLTELHADRLARQASGKLLLGNKHLSVSASARQALAAGKVDARLLSTLAVLAGTAHLNVHVLGFGDAGPGASPGIPMRFAVIAITAHGQQSGGAQYLKAALNFLRAQQAPFRAASMTESTESGQPVLDILFAAPSPLGLLGAGSP